MKLNQCKYANNQEYKGNRRQVIAHLVDGRTISVPLAQSWRLSEATPAQRSNYEIIGDGQGIHWPDIDENISVEGMLYGTPARRLKRKDFYAKADA